MLYFAYGSNMDWDQMRERCPSATFVCVAKLPEHRLAFTRRSKTRDCGVADAVPDAVRDVWGVVYEISERDIGNLDTSEGFSPGRARNSYTREERHVLIDGDERKPLSALVYFAQAQANPPLPNAEYRNLIVEGARFWRLPAPYVADLDQIEIALPPSDNATD